MLEPFEEIANLNKLIHEPARLAILTALSSCKSADFLFLQRLTGLTKGNLSGHLSKLEEAGLIEVEKEFLGKMPHTVLHLTNFGKTTITEHWRRLEHLRIEVEQWRRTEES